MTMVAGHGLSSDATAAAKKGTSCSEINLLKELEELVVTCITELPKTVT